MQSFVEIWSKRIWWRIRNVKFNKPLVWIRRWQDNDGSCENGDERVAGKHCFLSSFLSCWLLLLFLLLSLICIFTASLVREPTAGFFRTMRWPTLFSWLHHFSASVSPADKKETNFHDVLGNWRRIEHIKMRRFTNATRSHKWRIDYRS